VRWNCLTILGTTNVRIDGKCFYSIIFTLYRHRYHRFTHAYKPFTFHSGIHRSWELRRYRNSYLFWIFHSSLYNAFCTFFSSCFGYDNISFLFGDILMVPNSDLFFMAGVDLLLIVSIFFLYHRFLAISYDRDFALLQGLRVRTIYTFLFILMALTVVMSIRSVGLILVIALFSIPPFIAEKFTSTLKQMMIVSMFLSFLFCLSGLFLSYQFDLSTTPSIIIIAAIFFFGTLFYKRKLT